MANRVCRLAFVFIALGLAAFGLDAVCGETRAEDRLEKIVSIEGITEYRLDNGLQVLLFPDSSRPTVTVNLTVFVGSRHEGYGEAGMAHLLEHMVFKGTPLHKDIPQELQKRGAKFNGTTSADRTNYYETMPASDENLEFAIRLEADRMVNSYIKGEDLASEMTVVRNEFERGENSPIRVLIQRIASTAYEWHNYGQATIGNRSDIERVPLPKLREFYRRYYQPDNAMLVVSGRFETDRALELIEKYFGAIPRPERELDRTYTEEPPQDGERTVVLRRVGDLGIVGVAYHIPAGPHPDYAAVEVLSYILATEPAGRLYKSLVEANKASSVFGWAAAHHDPGLMMMMAEVPKDQSLRETRDAMLTEIERVGKEGATEEEVERVKRQILKERELALADSSQIAVQLSEWASQGDWRLFFLFRDRIEQVTADDVKRVAEKYLQRNNRTVGLFVPTQGAERIAIPATPNPKALVADYQGRESIAEGEDFDPSPENIEQRTQRFTLPGGLKVALLPKKTRGEAVQLRLNLRYGNQQNLQGFETAADLLPSLMTRGTQQLTYQQLQDELDKNNATLNAAGSAGHANFTIQTKRPNLSQVLDLLRQVLREATLPSEEFQVIRREQLAGLDRAKTDPQYLAARLLARTLKPYPKGDVRYEATIQEQIERLEAAKLDKIRTLYADYLNGNAGELVLVGDFDPDEIRPVLEEIFADWDAKHPYERIQQQAFVEVPGGTKTVLTPDKANAVYYAGQQIAISDEHPDYPALELGDFILGGGSLSSRLGNRVRQRDGLSYGVFSGFSANPLDDVGQFTIVAISNPENSPKVAAAIREEIDHLLQDGVDEDELVRAKSGYLQRLSVARTNDRTLAQLLATDLYVGRTMDFQAELERQISALTTDDVHTAFRRHFDPDRLVVINAGDFAAGQAEGDQ